MQELSQDPDVYVPKRPTLEGALKIFERYKRTPRAPQIDAIKHLEQEWDNATIHLIRGPVGVGKSLILRAVQEMTDGAIITSSNILVDQYKESFEDLNVVKGRKHYSCKYGDTCEDHFNDMPKDMDACLKYCGGCPFTKTRMRAAEEPSVFNPVTYFNLTKSAAVPKAPVVLIDEAHALPEFLRSLESRIIKPQYLPIGKIDISTPQKALVILQQSYHKIMRLVKLKKDANETGGLADDEEAVKYLARVIENLIHWPDHYLLALGPTGQGIQLISKNVPKYQVDTLLASNKIVMASGTLFPNLVQELFGRDIKSITYQCENPIPAENRLINVMPIAAAMNKDTPPAMYSMGINKIVEANPTKRGIIHMSYGLAEKLPGLNPRVLRHDKASKQDIKNIFLTAKEPLWLLASGMAEGLDLAGDKARVNVISKLSYPYIGDPYVKWRMEKPDGRLWYALQTLTHFMQAVGRTTRSAEDESITYVLDPGVSRLFETIRKCVKKEELHLYLPKDFMESVRF
jgi:Rad3-related DNA helicase